jgi:hypothetical protein
MRCHDDYSLARPTDFDVRRDVVAYLARKRRLETAAGKFGRSANFGPGDTVGEIR